MKDIVTSNSSRLFLSDTDIRYEDLEKKSCVGKQQITGRNLYVMAVRGAKAYKKALAYLKDKWDMVMLEPKKSGETIEDIIEYIRASMYTDLVSSKKNDGSSDEESESEEVAPSSTIITKDKENEVNVSKSNKNDASDGEYTDNDDSHSDEEEKECVVDIPQEYLFPSFFVFVVYGPFVPASDRLDILLVDNKDRKKGEGTRSQLRNKDAKDKALVSKHDTESQRGFSTDQRIDIEALDVQKEAMRDRKHEAALVGMSVEGSVLSKQIEAAERRAASRCSDYDPENVHWKKVDSLLQDQDKLLIKIRTFNDNMLIDKSEGNVSVSSFLNEPSPKKNLEPKGNSMMRWLLLMMIILVLILVVKTI